MFFRANKYSDAYNSVNMFALVIPILKNFVAEPTALQSFLNAIPFVVRHNNDVSLTDNPFVIIEEAEAWLSSLLRRKSIGA